MPDKQALEVFYGTIPLILVVVGIWLDKRALLKRIAESIDMDLFN